MGECFGSNDNFVLRLVSEREGHGLVVVALDGLLDGRWVENKTSLDTKDADIAALYKFASDLLNYVLVGFTDVEWSQADNHRLTLLSLNALELLLSSSSPEHPACSLFRRAPMNPGFRSPNYSAVRRLYLSQKRWINSFGF
ncbi:MAG: hypothetical protein MN733_20750 [Nitrososphaera sp.]|nr:hypothetical protein [Nitrososphaera sp.]